MYTVNLSEGGLVLLGTLTQFCRVGKILNMS